MAKYTTRLPLDIKIGDPKNNHIPIYDQTRGLWNTISSSSLIVSSSVSASFATTASYVAGNVLSASFSTTASYVAGNVLSSSFATTASYVAGNVLSASYALTSSVATSASYALTSSFSTTASYVAGTVLSASYALTSSIATSASYALTSSFSTTASYVAGNVLSASYALTSSIATSASYALTSSFSTTASYVAGTVLSASYALTASAATSITFTPSTASYALTSSIATSASYALTSSFSTTASYVAGTVLSASYALTSSIATSASYALTSSIATSASYALTSSIATSASYALTSSYANRAITIFPFSGSAVITGSLTLLSGSINIIFGGVTSSLFGTASNATTSSFSISSSFSTSASYVLTSSFATTASAATSITFTPPTASYALTSSIATSASYALTSSYANVATTIFPFSGSAVITGSLTLRSGSINVISGSVTASLFGTASVAITSSFTTTASYAVSSSFSTTASAATSITFTPPTASYALTSSIATSASYALTASAATSITFTPPTASYALTSSFSTTASAATSITFTPPTASYALTSSIATSASYALTSSYANRATTIFPFSGSAIITGSLTILSGSINIISGSVTGSLFGTASTAVSSSFATTASYVAAGSIGGTVTSAISASYALTASFATTASFVAGGSIGGTVTSAISASYALSSSFATTASLATSNISTASVNVNTITFTKGDGTQFNIQVSQDGTATSAISASYVEIQASSPGGPFYIPFVNTTTGYRKLQSDVDLTYNSSTNILNTTSSYALTSSIATSASYALSSSFTTTASAATSITFAVNTGSFTGSFIGIHSGSTFGTASVAVSASFATTASYVAAGAVGGTVTSASYALTSSYANRATTIFPFSGSAVITGSLRMVSGSINIISGGVTSSLFGTASNAVSSSFSTTASFSTTSSYALTSSFATTASAATSITFTVNTGSFTGSFIGTHSGSTFGTASVSISSSFATTASYVAAGAVGGTVTSASYALTSSYANVATTIFPFSGSAVITGSLRLLSGSITIISGGVTSSLFGTASIATSASFATTASAATSITFAVNTGSFTGSFIGIHSGSTFGTASVAVSASFATTASYIAAGSVGGTVTSASYALTSSFATTASYVDFPNVANKPALVSSSIQFTTLTDPFSGSFTGSFIGTHIGSTFGTASVAVSASFATTASYVAAANIVGTVTSASYAATASNLTGGTANYIPLWASATLLSSSTIYQSAGNVGIGTTSPAFTYGDGLEIKRSSATATLRLNSNVYATELSGLTGGTQLFQLSAGYLDLGTNNTTRLRIDSTGNIGIGTTSPVATLDVVGAVAIDGLKTLDTIAGNTVNGVINAVWGMLRPAGRKLYYDEDFNDGNNSISVYNNSGGTAVTHTRKNSSFAEGSVSPVPNKSGYVIEIRHAPLESSGIDPGYGGWYFATDTSPGSRRLLVTFKMKIPVGRAVNYASNTIGANGQGGWLTSTEGTGYYQDYAYLVHSGTATFSSTHFYYITGGSTTAFYTYLASATVYDVTDVGTEVVGAMGIGTNSPSEKLEVVGVVKATTLTSTQTTGTAPLTVASTTVVTNLNADLLDGQHGSYYTTAGNLTGTIPSAVLGNSSLYVGTTAIALNRASLTQTLTGVSIDGNAGSVSWANITGVRTLTRDDAGTSGSLTTSGFFETSTPTNYYSGASSWQHLIEARHTNDTNNYAMQLAGSFFDQEFYVRKTNNSGVTAWSKLWHSTNDGAGSGLDADLLDGYNSATAATANTIALRDGNGDLTNRYNFSSYNNSTDDTAGTTVTYVMAKFGDNYYRSATAAKVASFISGQTMNIVGTTTSASYATYADTSPVPPPLRPFLAQTLGGF